MTIVVAYTPSPSGEAALTAGLAEAHRRDTDVVPVNVAHGDIISEHKVATEAQLRTATTRANEIGVVIDIVQPRDSLPHYAITRTVHEFGADLLVIGLRKRSPVGKFIMGILARQLLVDAPCDIDAARIEPR